MIEDNTFKTSIYVDEKGKFKKGNAGRPKGATNKTTKELQQFITNFLNEKAFEIPLIWDSLEDKDKATLFLHLSKLVMPKQMTDAEQETGVKPIILNLGSGINPNQITIEQAREIANQLENDY